MLVSSRNKSNNEVVRFGFSNIGKELANKLEKSKSQKLFKL